MVRGLRRTLYPYMILLIIAFTPCTMILTCASTSEDTNTSSSCTRVVPLTIKVVLIGFDPATINTSYLTWQGNLPRERVSSIIDGENTGITFNLTYNCFFAGQDFRNQLTEYLRRIGGTVESYNPLWERETENTFYDANKVEVWLYDNNASYGGFPANGYTFIIANLTSLPSYSFVQYNDSNTHPPTPHYYNVTYTDRDRGYTPSYREFMVAWGGHHRFWFLDLSAGPEFWTWRYDAVPHLPLQVATGIFGIDVHTAFGKKWLTEYVADYVWEAIYNLAVPQFVYDPILTEKYRIVVNLLDNRTDAEKAAAPISSTVNAEWIRGAFEDLTPYINTSVEVRFKNTSDYPDLQKLILDHYYLPTPELEAQGWAPYVDLRPIYEYLQENLEAFVANISRDEEEFTIPVFAFAFSNQTVFGITFKWSIARLHPEERYLWGIALGDMCIISMPQEDFLRGDIADQPGKGFGFTETIIHEVGHAVGLMHPHQFGMIGDFESSAMSYFTFEYNFSQFDKDAIRRAHADKTIIEASSTVREIQLLLPNRFPSTEIENLLSRSTELLTEAEAEYNKMNYTGALLKALEARESSSEGLNLVKRQPLTASIFAIIAAGTGFVSGCLVTFLVLRKKRKHPALAYAQPMATPMFCPNCRAALTPETVYCPQCGKKIARVNS